MRALLSLWQVTGAGHDPIINHQRFAEMAYSAADLTLLVGPQVAKMFAAFGLAHPVGQRTTIGLAVSVTILHHDGTV